MGDSGCSVFRDGKILFATPSLTHYFNCPVGAVDCSLLLLMCAQKQLSKIPKHMRSGGIIHDTFENPASFDTFQIDLLPGDVITLYVCLHSQISQVEIDVS
jgi:protein phosphatase PTC7